MCNKRTQYLVHACLMYCHVFEKKNVSCVHLWTRIQWLVNFFLCLSNINVIMSSTYLLEVLPPPGVLVPLAKTICPTLPPI
jgi:hypothetical protein